MPPTIYSSIPLGISSNNNRVSFAAGFLKESDSSEDSIPVYLTVKHCGHLFDGTLRRFRCVSDVYYNSAGLVAIERHDLNFKVSTAFRQRFGEKQ
jgi:hypothetical protein